MDNKLACVFLYINILGLLPSCSTRSPYLKESPEWVSQLRTGESSMIVESNDKFLFRSVYSEKGKKIEDTCQSSLEKNKEFIQHSYPFIKQVPMSIELIYYDPKFEDCSTTISINKELVKNANGLKAVESQYDSAMKDIQKEKKALESRIKDQKEDNFNLKQKIKSLEKLIQNNSYLLKKAEKMESQVAIAQDRIKSLNNKVKNYVTNGMTYKEINKIVDTKLKVNILNNIDGIDRSTRSSCWKTFKTSNYSQHGGYSICWTNDYPHAIVVGYCETQTKTCWTRTP